MRFEAAASKQAVLEFDQPLELKGVILQVEEKTSPKNKPYEGGGKRKEYRDFKDKKSGVIK